MFPSVHFFDFDFKIPKNTSSLALCYTDDFSPPHMSVLNLHKISLVFSITFPNSVYFYEYLFISHINLLYF
nr:hypothetical protein CJLB15_00082 [Campylobacter phage CJLB-15]